MVLGHADFWEPGAARSAATGCATPWTARWPSCRGVRSNRNNLLGTGPRFLWNVLLVHSTRTLSAVRRSRFNVGCFTFGRCWEPLTQPLPYVPVTYNAWMPEGRGAPRLAGRAALTMPSGSTASQSWRQEPRAGLHARTGRSTRRCPSHRAVPPVHPRRCPRAGRGTTQPPQPCLPSPLPAPGRERTVSSSGERDRG